MPSTINNLYTGWNILFGMLSIVSLGFVIKNHDSQPDNSMDCKVNLVNIHYTLCQLILASLIARIFFALIHMCVFVNTYKSYVSYGRKIFYTFLSLVYGLCIFFSVIMIIKFKNNTDCYKYYKDNNKYFYNSFSILCGVFIIDFIWFLAGIISMCCCSNNDEYSINSNDYKRIY
jgi:hypothetical protein